MRMKGQEKRCNKLASHFALYVCVSLFGVKTFSLFLRNGTSSPTSTCMRLGPNGESACVTFPVSCLRSDGSAGAAARFCSISRRRHSRSCGSSPRQERVQACRKIEAEAAGGGFASSAVSVTMTGEAAVVAIPEEEVASLLLPLLLSLTSVSASSVCDCAYHFPILVI